MTIGNWPSSGEAFVLFEADEAGERRIICWTPAPHEWRTIRQVLSGLSQARKP